MTPEENDKIKSLTNRSDVFNHVIEHLRRQGKQSILINFEGEETCAYRGENGTMCAAGCLIADDEYSPWFESNSIYTLVRFYLFVTPDLKERIEPNERMISDLQSLHDHHLAYKNGEFTVTTKTFIDKLREKWGIK